MQAAYGIQVGWRGYPSRQQGGYEGQGCQDIRVARGEILLAIDLIFAAWLHKVANYQNMSDSEFIAARQERWRAAHNSLDPDKLMALMAEDCDYSDHGNYHNL
jgi:hypothetical protein